MIYIYIRIIRTTIKAVPLFVSVSMTAWPQRSLETDVGSCGPLLSLAQAGSCDMLPPPWLSVHGCQPVLPFLGLTVNKKEPLLELLQNLNLAHLLYIISKILVESRYRKLCRKLRPTNHSASHQVDICRHSQLNPLFWWIHFVLSCFFRTCWTRSWSIAGLQRFRSRRHALNILGAQVCWRQLDLFQGASATCSTTSAKPTEDKKGS